MGYVAPEFRKDGFTCPNCDIFSKQNWEQLLISNNRIKKYGIYKSSCDYCENISIWYGENVVYDSFNGNYLNEGKMVYPKRSNISLPNKDLSDEIKKDYLEASSVLNDSPRGACALLRLALQKLMIQLGEDGKDINKNIGNLVKKGLDTSIQKSLDSVRIIGNESVHPGELDLKDNIEIASKLFSMINIIANALITQKREIEELYSVIPESKLEGIKNRDK